MKEYDGCPWKNDGYKSESSCFISFFFFFFCRRSQLQVTIPGLNWSLDQARLKFRENATWFWNSSPARYLECNFSQLFALSLCICSYNFFLCWFNLQRDTTLSKRDTNVSIHKKLLSQIVEYEHAHVKVSFLQIIYLNHFYYIFICSHFVSFYFSPDFVSEFLLLSPEKHRSLTLANSSSHSDPIFRVYLQICYQKNYVVDLKLNGTGF